ncbi:MAG: CPBP family intramembrane metalloprotease [Christensenellaceae bacterium]|nr:CPBP family intramembrane metalloprotease [Christensenellaceae bacterium]
MKRFWAAIGIGVACAAGYMLLQGIVSIVFMIPYIASTLGADVLALDVVQITAEATAYLYEKFAYISIITNVLTFFILWGVYALMRRNIFQEIRLVPVKARSLLPNIGLAAGLGVVICLVLSLLPEEAMASYIEQSNSVIYGVSLPLAMLSTVLFAPILEEILFRGVVYGTFKRAMPRGFALLLSSLIFGALHGQLIWILYAAVVGCVMALVYDAYGSLLANIVFHIVFNLVGGYFTVLLDFPTLPPRFIALALALALCAWCVYKIKRLRRDDLPPLDIASEGEPAGNDEPAAPIPEPAE